jgi:ribonucleoside-diphosphate reductase alpha chain/ribonucleoside-triphosphate reductase
MEPQYNFDGTPDKNTFVVSFPCAYPAGTKLANQVSAIEQLDMVRWLQKNWSDNAVSCTVYYRKDELSSIKEYLTKYYDNEIKTCSFLLHQDHGFKQAPYEEITEDEYLSRKSQVRPITSLSTDTSVIESDCEGGACPVR